jgi:hypothetical protein
LTIVPALLASALLFAAATGPIQKAETLAAAAKAAPTAPASLAEARRALVLTEEFDPLRFVDARKGIIIEDTYREALGRYRTHRALLYEAVGECLVRQGQAREGVRHLRRAYLLDAGGGRLAALARGLLRDERAAEALDLLARRGPAPMTGDLLAVAGQAADVAAVPSLQAELDRARLAGVTAESRPEAKDGPVSFGERLRLSTGAPFRLDEDGITLIYVADPGCRSCSSDIEALARVVPQGLRILVAPAVPDQDHPLRQALTLYRQAWPVILGARAGAYGDIAPVAWIVGRRGWSAATVRPSFARSLPAVLDVFQQRDVDEALPRPAWNRRPVVRKAVPAPPALLDDGLAPGEDDPPPPEFAEAVAAFRAGRPQDALRLFEVLENRGDGWLLSPEARLDRALCVAAAGKHEAARTLLRRIGDSRFQERVDQALESLPR